MARGTAVSQNSQGPPTPPLLRLAPELIIEICEYLAQEHGLRTLRHFSTTCPKIRRSAIPVLFRHVRRYKGHLYLGSLEATTFMSDDKALKRAVQTMRFDASAFEAEPFLLRWGTAGLVSVLQRLSSFGNLRRLVFHFPDLHLVKAEGILKGLQRDLFPVVKSLETSPEGVFVNRLCPHLSRHSIFYCTGWSQRNCERDPEGPKDQFKSAFRELMNRVRYAKGITHLEMDMESNWHHPGTLDQITQSFPNLTELVLYAQRMPFHPASTLPMLSRMTELRVLHLPHMDELWYDRDGTIDQRLYDGEPAHYWDLCRMALRMFSAVPTLQRIGSGRFWDRYYLMDVVYGEHGGMLGIDTSDLRPGEETLNLWRDFDLVDLWQNGTTTNKKHRAVAEIRVFASAT